VRPAAAAPIEQVEQHRAAQPRARVRATNMVKARAVGAIDDDDDDDDDDVGFGERRRRVAQRGSATYRFIDSDRQILQH